jgi:hypothetical protein
VRRTWIAWLALVFVPVLAAGLGLFASAVVAGAVGCGGCGSGGGTTYP